MKNDTVDDRIWRLAELSTSRFIEPDVEVPGQIGSGAVLPTELLSTAGLDIELSEDQKSRLSREEVASMFDAGLRLEAMLTAAVGIQLVSVTDLTDPRVIYILHVIGEETRHSRIFSRILWQLKPTARNPIDRSFIRSGQVWGLTFLAKRPALFEVLTLAGDEIPDMFQRKTAFHPDTDPFLVAVNRYHRQEEARHIAFARTVLGEHWAGASLLDRIIVRWVIPPLIQWIFEFMVHPGVYETIGLPAWSTWRSVNRSSQRVQLRYESTRPILSAMLESKVFRSGRVPPMWRRLCGVNESGAPVG